MHNVCDCQLQFQGYLICEWGIDGCFVLIEYAYRKILKFESYRNAAGRQYSNQVVDDILLDFMIWMVKV